MNPQILVVLFFAHVYADVWPLPYNPVADPGAVVLVGNARFTVLTPNLIRMEFANQGIFEDRSTIAFVNRLLPVPPFTSAESSGILAITTSALQLTYRVGSRFTNETLKIISLLTDVPFTWVPGMPNNGNLLGTIKSLDLLDVISLNCTENSGTVINDESLHCSWGLISKQGWSLVNDTEDWAFGTNGWWQSPNKDIEDLYFFGHGRNYLLALSDYSMVGGKITMVPRYALGIWWSIWDNINNVDVKHIVSEYQSRSLPLDVFILDMDWHTKQGWGGYTFDTNLFPAPADTLSFLHDSGLYVAANLHDYDGVRPTEKTYTRMAQTIGVIPGQTIPFQISNATYAFALEDIVLSDVEGQGMNFWWIDWQQGGNQGGCSGGAQNPTIMLNHARSTDHTRRQDTLRTLVLGRWGGLGNHRYQVGFSGDVRTVSWSNLAFQPYFSWTASNVGYGFWSHDLVGPQNGDHELHLRWIQWGAYSGIFRTHDRGMSAGGCIRDGTCSIVKVWEVPNTYYEPIREAMISRVTLVPYIYTALREAFDSGVSLVRPMYYYYPTEEFAYAGDSSGKFGQYLFGADLMVAPVTTPSKKNTSMADSTIWIPPGNWFEIDTGVLHTGPSILKKSFDLSEIPVFARAGTIVPSLPYVLGDTLGMAHRQFTSVVFTFYPGVASGYYSLYEDDGYSTLYLKAGGYSWTDIKYNRDAASGNIQISIQRPDGTYPGQLLQKSYVIKIVNWLPPTQAFLNGAAIPYSKFSLPNTWLYDGNTFTTVITSPVLPISNNYIFSLAGRPVDDAMMSGLKGIVRHSLLAKKELDKVRLTPGSQNTNGGVLNRLASTGGYLSYLAGNLDLTEFFGVLSGIKQSYGGAIDEVARIKPPAQPEATYDAWARAMELLQTANS